MDIFSSLPQIESIEYNANEGYPKQLVDAAQPVVLKGFIRDWPLVKVAQESTDALKAYLLAAYNDNPVHLMQAPAECKGRLFYNQDLSGFNFTRSHQNLRDVFSAIKQSQTESNPPTRYVGSTMVDSIFPSLRKSNDIGFLPNALASIWMGNQSRIAAHHDAPDNFACNVAGQRRFTLFPPEQIENLYIGPIDFTPAGQAASLVDFHAPDFDKYPKFKQALVSAQCAVLSPGDAIYIPATWWHHVEALSDFNILVNYWWRQVDDHVGVPNDALIHAMLAIKSLPQAQREAWKAFFEHYVFSPAPNKHIPEDKLGMLDEVSPLLARKMRALLINKINR
ncbi:cupin-like domain-containing protein [Glaciecola sp. 1036]|uniref:cupin-like domain-containing protein n=1 Tax=Alteromonadaceae TaxID=72275 RepID=UPI003D04211E